MVHDGAKIDDNQKYFLSLATARTEKPIQLTSHKQIASTRPKQQVLIAILFKLNQHLVIPAYTAATGAAQHFSPEILYFSHATMSGSQGRKKKERIFATFSRFLASK